MNPRTWRGRIAISPDFAYPYGYMFYRGTDNRIWARHFGLWKYNGSQNMTFIYEAVSPALAAGDPAINTKNSVVYRGTDGRVWSTWWNGSSWSTAAWGLTANVKGDVVADPADSGRVYYRGTDNCPWSCYWSYNKFVSAQLSAVPNMGTDPACNRSQSLVFADIYGQVYSVWNQWGIWNLGSWGPNKNAASKLTVGTWDGVTYYKGTDSCLWSCYWDGSKFVNAKRGILPNVAGGIVVNSAGVVFYVGTDGYLWRY